MAVEFRLSMISSASKQPMLLVILYSILSYTALSNYMTDNSQLFLNAVVFMLIYIRASHEAIKRYGCNIQEAICVSIIAALAKNLVYIILNFAAHRFVTADYSIFGILALESVVGAILFGAMGVGLAFRNTKNASRLSEIIQLVGMPVINCAIVLGILLGLWLFLPPELNILGISIIISPLLLLPSLFFYINPFLLLLGAIVMAYAGFHAARKGLGFEGSLIAATLTALVLFNTQLAISVAVFFAGLTPGNPSSIDSISGYLYSVLVNFPSKQYLAIIYGIVAGVIGEFLARRLAI